MEVYFVIYLFLLCAALLSKNSSLLYFITICFISVLIGYRSEDVGVDTPNYIEMFEMLKDGYNGYPEPVYGILCFLAGSFGLSFSLFQSILVFCCLILLSRSIKNSTSFYCFPLLLLLNMYLFCYAMNIYRQIIACLICVFACWSYVNDKKKLKFISYVMLAAGFHLFALSLLIIFFIGKIKLKDAYVYCGIFFSLIIGFISVFDYLTLLFGSYGELYLERDADLYVKTGTRLIMAYFMAIYWIIGFLYLLKRSVHFRDSIYIKLFFIGIILFNILIRHDLGLRVSLFFISPMVIGLPIFLNMIDEGRKRTKILIIGYTSLYYFVFIAINSAGVVPYKMF